MPMNNDRRTLREAGAGAGPARRRLRRCLLRAAGVEEGRRSRTKIPLDDIAAQRAVADCGELGGAPTGPRRDGALAAPLPRAAARGARRPRAHAERRAPVVRRGVDGALRRGGADLSRVALSGDSRPARQAVSRQRAARRPLRRVPRGVHHPARPARRGLPGGHRRLPRADARST